MLGFFQPIHDKDVEVHGIPETRIDKVFSDFLREPINPHVGPAREPLSFTPPQHYPLGPYCLMVGSPGVKPRHNRVLIDLSPFDANNSPPLHCLVSGIDKEMFSVMACFAEQLSKLIFCVSMPEPTQLV